MKNRLRLATPCRMAILLLFVSMVAFLGACRKPTGDADENREAQAAKAPAQTSTDNGRTVLTLDAPTQKRLEIQIAALASAVTRERVDVPALALSAQDLATSRNSYVGAQGQLQKSRIEEDVADREYARLKSLFDESQNISQKSLQSAEGTLMTSQAEVRAAEQQLSLQEAAVRQEWGPVVAQWLVDGSPNLQALFDQNKILVQMTIPPTVKLEPPNAASLEMPGGNRTEVSFVSSFPRTDPRIQGRSFLYIATAQPGLAPGVNLVAHLSVGNQMKGVIVPASAVVWSEGQAWVYEEESSEHFSRHPLTSDVQLENGFFVSRGFSTGDRVVIQGAQDLLSQELLSHGEGGGDSDEN